MTRLYELIVTLRAPILNPEIIDINPPQAHCSGTWARGT
jgi:hypothetical protein